MKRPNKIVYTIFFFLCVYFNSSSCLASHFYTATLDELVNGSSFVFVGEVKNIKRTLFGYRKAKVKILEKIKGKVLEDLTVKYGEPWYYSQNNVPVLDEGKHYLFFVVETDGESHLAGIVGKKYYVVEDNGEVLCGDEKIKLKECINKGRNIADK